MYWYKLKMLTLHLK